MKKVFSMCLFFGLCLCFVTPSFATNFEAQDINTMSDTIAADMFYEKETISFLQDKNEIMVPFSANGEMTDREIHLANVEAAREFVLSLNLPSQGLELIEEACLAELDMYEEAEDIVLESYTVLLPSKMTRVAKPSGLSLLGTKNGRSFYYTLTSQSAYIAQNGTETNLRQLQNWADGALSMVLNFAPAQITVPYTVFRTLFGMPTGWTVKTGSYAEYYVRIAPTTRNIYTEISTNSWMHLLSNQTGTAEPYVVFHNTDTKYDASKTKIFAKQTVSTGDYNKTDTQISMAYSQWEWGAYGSNPFTLTLINSLPSLKISWK